MNLLQGLCLWVLGLSEFLDLTIVLFDPQCHLCDLFQHRVSACAKAAGITARLLFAKQRVVVAGILCPQGLRETTHGVDCRGAESNQTVSGTDQGKRLLLLDGSVGDRAQDLRIQPCVAGKLFGTTLSLFRPLCEIARSSRMLATITSCPSF